MKIFVLVLLFNSMLSMDPAKRSGETEYRCAIRSFQNEYDASEAVFVGEVVETKQVENKKYFVFKVKRYWKGVRSEKIKLLVYENPRFQASYEDGKTFLVFAKKNDEGVLYDARCSRSAEIGGTSSDLEDDLEKLGKAKTCIDLEDSEGVEVEKRNN